MTQTMKDTAYRVKCIEKVLNHYSGLDVMLGLGDIAFDIFLLSLKEKNKKLTKKQLQHIIKEISEWKKTTSRS